MRTVWKFPIRVREGQANILPELPADSRTVLVGLDPGSGHLALWIELDPAAPRSTRCLAVAGTGHEVPEGWQHVGSAIDGAFVWHVYEVTP